MEQGPPEQSVVSFLLCIMPLGPNKYLTNEQKEKSRVHCPMPTALKLWFLQEGAGGAVCVIVPPGGFGNAWGHSGCQSWGGGWLLASCGWGPWMLPSILHPTAHRTVFLNEELFVLECQ